MTELLDDDFERAPIGNKQRHGCVTAWLIFMIVASAISALTYLFARGLISEMMPGTGDSPLFILLGFVAILNVIFAIMIFQWKRIGFYGFIVTGVIAFVINLIMGIGVGQSVMGLVGIGILYAILQIEQEGESAWKQLD